MIKISNIKNQMSNINPSAALRIDGERSSASPRRSPELIKGRSRTVKYQKSKLHNQVAVLLKNFKPCPVALFFIFCFLAFNCYANSVSSTELINNAAVYDGKTLVYEGEVIGDIMVRGEFAWINIKNNEHSIGIWLSKDLAKEITYTGSYESKGDWVEITGIFHRACGEHGGDLDIHAQNMRKISPGAEVQRPIDLDKRNLVFALLGILCLVLILRQLKIK